MKFFRTFSLPIKIACFYIILNLIVFIPLNKYIRNNIEAFNTIYKDSKRLYDYDRMPGLSLEAHWINKYSGMGQKTVIIVGDSKTEDYYVGYSDSIAARLDKILFGVNYGQDGEIIPPGIPNVYNFGSSGTKAVYVMERMKKAAGYKPDLIIWQMGSGSFQPVKWVLGYSARLALSSIQARFSDASGNTGSFSIYDISLGGRLAAAYSNIPKLNDQNAPFVSAELRAALVPLAGYKVFFARYFEGLWSSLAGTPLTYPEDRFRAIGVGDGAIPYFESPLCFDPSYMHFDVISDICGYISGENIPMMIYIDQIRSDVRRSKFEESYYEKFVSAVSSESSPYGVPVLDLHDAVPDEYFVDGGHVKEKGNEIIASKLADFIVMNFSEELFAKSPGNHSAD